jgi:hypothetical protein
VSCGRLTDTERQLGDRIAAEIRKHDMDPFFADQVHSPDDLNSAVFKRLQQCDAFVAVMHRRGEIHYRKYVPMHRASVWIQQEVALLAYRMFLQGRTIPTRVFMKKGILLEGVMKTAIINPIEFNRDEDMRKGLREWLSGSEYALQQHATLRVFSRV